MHCLSKCWCTSWMFSTHPYFPYNFMLTTPIHAYTWLINEPLISQSFFFQNEDRALWHALERVSPSDVGQGPLRGKLSWMIPLEKKKRSCLKKASLKILPHRTQLQEGRCWTSWSPFLKLKGKHLLKKFFSLYIWFIFTPAKLPFHSKLYW